MLGNLADIIAQVSGLVVVDNGSTIDEVSALRAAHEALGFHLIENSDNLGIAEALNQGVQWARSKSFPWVLLFDQDSRITDGFVDSMFRSWRADPRRDLVVTVQPRYVDPITGHASVIHRTSDDCPLYSMTSGSLLPTWAFDTVGWFASDYFIDYVDVEYSLRARARGYVLIESRDAVLLHRAGNPSTHRLFGVISYRPLNHSAQRRYYMTRNRIVTARRYYYKFPRWAMEDMLQISKEITKMLIGENDRRKKVRAMLRGAIDGIAGRMGKISISNAIEPMDDAKRT
jgi:rhamnosyltransferase